MHDPFGSVRSATNERTRVEAPNRDRTTTIDIHRIIRRSRRFAPFAKVHRMWIFPDRSEKIRFPSTEEATFHSSCPSVRRSSRFNVTYLTATRRRRRHLRRRRRSRIPNPRRRVHRARAQPRRRQTRRRNHPCWLTMMNANKFKLILFERTNETCRKGLEEEEEEIRARCVRARAFSLTVSVVCRYAVGRLRSFPLVPFHSIHKFQNQEKQTHTERGSKPRPRPDEPVFDPIADSESHTHIYLKNMDLLYIVYG